uniref:E3 ubiquitin-protein ligase UPL1 isoform X1 n=1 Tax=Rhizophora mucronata TaxID=61149 RepID=A0A2P2M8S3_RHIMU
METVNPQPLKGRSYEEVARRRMALVDGGGGFDAEEEAVNGAFEEVARTNPRTAHKGNGSNVKMVQQASRTSELTIAFEGEVYVFPAVTPQKVQAVLLLLEGADTPTSSVPTSEFLKQKNTRSFDDMSRSPRLTQRIASLVRFREKRKDRCFEKKIRYTCRKEVAERYSAQWTLKDKRFFHIVTISLHRCLCCIALDRLMQPFLKKYIYFNIVI